MKPHFSQHFLTDNNIANDIVSQANLNSGDIVWEIGAGKGALTDILINYDIDLTIFEIDRNLIPNLKKKYGHKCKIVHADILKVNWKEEISKGLKIVTNLPYQISSPFLYKLTENHTYFDCIVVMLQKEFAKRLAAKPGKKDYGVLTLKTQFFFDIEYLFDVPADRFVPVPKVESAVVRMVQRKELPVFASKTALPLRAVLEGKYRTPSPSPPSREGINFWQIIELSFSSRRKTLKNNLKSVIKQHNIDVSNCPIDLNRRGETLSEKEFIALYEFMGIFIAG